MSLQELQALFFPNSLVSTAPSFTSGNVIDAAGEKVAFIFRVPKSGTISKLGFRVSTVASSQTLRVSLQTVDGSGAPTGTNYGGSLPGTQTSPALNTNYTVSLATSATAVRGDWVAAVIEFDSTVGNLSIAATSIAPPYPIASAYINTFTAAWGKTTAQPIGWVEYSDGSYSFIPGLIPATGVTARSFGVNTAGADEYGIKLNLPVALSIDGIFLPITLSAGNTLEVCLYEGSTLIEAISIDSDLDRAPGSFLWRAYLFASRRDLAANTDYRITVRPTAATTVTMYEYSYPNINVMAQEGITSAQWQSSIRLNQGAFSDTTTNRVLMSLIPAGINTAQGGGAAIGLGGLIA